MWCGVVGSISLSARLLSFSRLFSLSSQAAIAPAATPGQVPGEGEVVLLLLLTFCAFCTVGPATRAPAVMIFSRLFIFRPAVLAGLAAA